MPLDEFDYDNTYKKHQAANTGRRMGTRFRQHADGHFIGNDP